MNKRVRELRKTLNMTLDVFGARIGLKKSSLSQIENGVNNLTEQSILLICKEFNVNEEWLRTGQGETFKEHPPVDEVASYVEDLLDHEAVENPFFDIIVEMMRTYHELDEPARIAALKYFRKLRENLEQKKEG